MDLKSIKEVKNLLGKRVLLRLDLDVAVSDDGKVHKSDDARLEASLPTLRYLLKKGSNIIIVGHRGRPKGKVDKSLGIKPIADRICVLLGSDSEVHGVKLKEFDAFSFKVSGKSLSVLENIRFYPGEILNNTQLAKKLSGIADIYVNDAFAVSHRPHASVSAITKYLPSYAGLRLIKEVANLGKALKRPPRPLTLIMGGVKITTKLALMEKFLPRADYLLTGSALANNFYKEIGFDVGLSRTDRSSQMTVKRLIKNHKYRILDSDDSDGMLLNPDDVENIDLGFIKSIKKRIILPVDVTIGDMTDNSLSDSRRITKPVRVNDSKLSPSPYGILDIGKLTISLYSEIIKKSKTIIWNGPMGMFENPIYDLGTKKIAQAVASSNGRSIVGGGDTVSAIEGDNIVMKKNTFISTGGGAMLEFLINPLLPGIKPLVKR